jgi:hypothetical protein
MTEGLNMTTRRGDIRASSPVLGLRPMRSRFLRTTNEPNDDSFTVSHAQTVQDFFEHKLNECRAFDTRQADLLMERLR